MNDNLRILNPKFYICPNTDPFHIDCPTEDGRFEIQQTLCANHILIIVLILRHMVILRSLLSSFFVFAHCSYAKLGHVI